MDVGLHGQVLAGGLQILAQREDAATGPEQVIHGLEKLGFSLAQAQHQARFGGDAFVGELLEYSKAALVAGGRTHLGGEAAHRFHIV